MALVEAADYIDQALEIPTVEWISLTGGEPFLLPETLLELVSYTASRGFHTECVTNCFWATTKEEAERILKKLVDVGLDAINISADDFHQRHIPFDRVRNCYEAAKKLGLKIIIMCAAAKSSRLRVKEVTRLLEDKDIRIIGAGSPKDHPVALAIETGFIPIGRAMEIPTEEWLVSNGSFEGPCRAILRDVGIAPSGNVLPCCSAAASTDTAAIGNVKHNKLRRLIEEASHRPLFRTLSAEGPLGLQRLLGSKRRDNYVNRCHLCYDLLTDPCLGQVL